MVRVSELGSAPGTPLPLPCQALTLCSLPGRLYLERQQLSYRLHSVACTGNEVHISMCPFEFYKGNATAACKGGMPAVVSCKPGPLFTTGSALKKKKQGQQQGQVSALRGFSMGHADCFAPPTGYQGSDASSWNGGHPVSGSLSPRAWWGQQEP